MAEGANPLSFRQSYLICASVESASKPDPTPGTAFLDFIVPRIPEGQAWTRRNIQYDLTFRRHFQDLVESLSRSGDTVQWVAAPQKAQSYADNMTNATFHMRVY